MTLQEAAKRIGKSESTIRRMIRAGTLTAPIIKGKYDVSEESVNAYLKPRQMDSQMPSQDAELIAQMQAEIDYLRKELSDSREQSNTIIMQMTRQIETLQLPPSRKPPLWKRIFKKK